MTATLPLDTPVISNIFDRAGYSAVNKGLAYNNLVNGVPVVVLVDGKAFLVISLSKLANWCLYLKGKTPVRFDYDDEQLFYSPK